ncbi:MAG TPA: alkaline phosphatase family protein [Clostridia bacterium]|nr:alkaline phosphatase family protein [Clostridia bacterium]
MSKLLVFCIDALCASDVEAMRSMPHFGSFLKNAAVVESIEPAWPALTYCCHTSILTGCYVDRHGIGNNEIMRRGGHFRQPWHCMKADVLVPTLLDYARERGLSTCSISWPVSGGAKYDLNMPMIVPYHYVGWEPEQWLKGTATKELIDRYFYKHGRYIKGPDRSLDLLTMALSLDILEDYEQPDVMLVKMCDLDGSRHLYGVHNEHVQNQLRKHDEEFGSLIEALNRKGTLSETNIVILGDHGQTDIQDVIHLNVLLRDNGFIRIGEDGTLESFDAILHSTGLAAYVELGDPDNFEMKARVRTYLESLKDDPRIQISYVMDREEAKATYHVDGPFDFIIESRLPISFGERYDLPGIYGSKIPGNHKVGAATHGGSPAREEVTTFLAAGPNVLPGAVVKRRSMVDEAPTMARMLGFTMPDTDGSAIEEILR